MLKKNKMLLFEKSVREMRTEYNRIHKRHPDRIPVLVDARAIMDADEMKKHKHKYLVTPSLLISQFQSLVRAKLTIEPEQAVFFMVNNELVSGITSFAELAAYSERYVHESGFIIIRLELENAFG